MAVGAKQGLEILTNTYYELPPAHPTMMRTLFVECANVVQVLRPSRVAHETRPRIPGFRTTPGGVVPTHATPPPKPVSA